MKKSSTLKTGKNLAKKLRKLPTVSKYKPKEDSEFPVEAYSYSSMTKFTANPFMFKVNNINGDELETVNSASNVLGRVIHEALKWYLGGGDEPTPVNETEAVGFAFDKGKQYLDGYSDGFIKYNTIIENRAELESKYCEVFYGYIKEFDYLKRVTKIELVEQMLKSHVEVDGKFLPVPLKGMADLVYRDKMNRICIWDHKITAAYSRDDEIDGAKLLQAAINYLLVCAELGEKPYKIVFGEYKHTKNRDGSPQLKPYEFIYKDMPLMFDLFFRLYEDITKALMGEQVFVPNLNALYDKEVSILAYIHRLDVNEELANQMKEKQVSNITDLLKEKLVEEKSLKRYEKVVSEQFISSKTLNYKDMTIEDRIKRKLAEHGIAVEFHSKVKGSAVTLYRYEPSIGVKMARVEQFVKDVEQAVGKSGVRVLAPIPDSELIGFEIPNDKREFPGKAPTKRGFELAIGVDVMGEVFEMDLREAPHMLVAGATGSGKSVFVNSIIEQITQNVGKASAELVLLDPKGVEFSPYQEQANVKTYANSIYEIDQSLLGLVNEMNSRFDKFKKLKTVRNIEQYRESGKQMPYIFCFIDEFGDLIVSKFIEERQVFTGEYDKQGRPKHKIVKRNVSEDIKKNIMLLGQKARAAGIHLILTTQRPSIQIVDGAIKANFPTRAAFKTSSDVDSQVILGKNGAEKLLGKGDMLFQNTKSEIKRLQSFNI